MKVRTTAGLAIAVVAAAITVVLVVFRSTPIEAVYPLERLKAAANRSIRARVAALWNAQRTVSENLRLRREVASLSLAMEDAERLASENARLRRALDYVSNPPEVWIPAEVLSRGGAAAGRADTIRLGVGSNAGVSADAVVVTPDGLVGRVSNVTAHTCEVVPITDPTVQVACEFETTGDSQVRGVTAGGTAELITVRHIRGHGGSQEAIAPRSRVVTSGLGGVFPQGIEIGSWIGDGVMPSVDFEALTEVFIRRRK